jgi:hypothetical protein
MSSCAGAPFACRPSRSRKGYVQHTPRSMMLARKQPHTDQQGMARSRDGARITRSFIDANSQVPNGSLCGSTARSQSRSEAVTVGVPADCRLAQKEMNSERFAVVEEDRNQKKEKEKPESVVAPERGGRSRQGQHSTASLPRSHPTSQSLHSSTSRVTVSGFDQAWETCTKRIQHKRNKDSPAAVDLRAGGRGDGW